MRRTNKHKVGFSENIFVSCLFVVFLSTQCDQFSKLIVPMQYAAIFKAVKMVIF